MTIRQLIKNIRNPVNLWYIIQAKIRRAIKPLPDKEILAKVARHPQCFFSGECQRCGCDVHEVMTSDKECKDVMEGDTIALKTEDGQWVIMEFFSALSEDNTFIVLNRIKDED